MTKPPDGTLAEPQPRPTHGALSSLLAGLARAPEVERSGWDGALHAGAIVDGRFELLRELGRGGFGAVWEARDRVLGRSVAVKAVRRVGRPERVAQRLLDEAELAARLSHPNIVTLFDCGRALEGPYLVQELLRGETLAARLERGPLVPVEALRVAQEIARGLAHAHAHGVVHRDLKPENVFLCEGGGVKLLDLGLAHAFAHPRIAGGTPGYMAPEQLRGAPEDERTDVFALGVLLFQMLERATPSFSDGDLTGLNVHSFPPAAPLLRGLLALDPIERPRDGAAVVEALSAFTRELDRERSVVAAKVPERRATEPEPSIAVLPFADIGAGEDREYFAEGVAEEILSALTSVRGLRVAGRTSSSCFRGSRDDVGTIAAKLGVRTLLEGSVRRAGDRARITARLVSAPDGFTHWSHTYDRDVTDVFAVQEEIATAVVSALRVTLAAGAAPVAAPRRTPRPEVYDAYLVARRLLERRDLDGQSGAVAAYERAIALDPGYAPAWADLAEALFWSSDLAADAAAGETQRRRALDAAERAVALDARLATSWSTRGFLRVFLNWDFPGAREDFERAVALASGDARVLREYGCTVLVPLGRESEGRTMLERAADLDPFDALAWTYLAMTYAGEGELDATARAAERALRLDPTNPYAAFWKAAACLIAGYPADALTAADWHVSRAHELFGLTIAAMAHHSLRDDRRSREAMNELATTGGAVMPYQVAEILAWRGAADDAFVWLERARASKDAGLVLVTRDPFLQRLRGDARFAALLRAMNLRD